MSRFMLFFLLLVVIGSTFLGCEGAPTVIVVGKRKNRGMSGGRMSNGGQMNGYGSKYGEDGMDMAKSWNSIGQEYAKWPIGQAGGR